MAVTAHPHVAIVGPVRLSYLNVFTPRMNNAKVPPAPEFGALLLIPKEPNEFCLDPEAVRKSVFEIIKSAAQAKFGDATKGLKSPLKDGDKDFDDDGNPRNPGYWTLRVSCKAEYPPVLIDGKRNPVTGGWESGDWGKVKVNFWTYDTAGNKGVSGGLRAVQFLFKDEALGVSNSPEAVAAEFDEVPNAHVVASTSAAPNPDDYDPFAE